MAELKKCPFCGGEAYSYKSKNLLGEMFWGIECESNECIVHTMTAEYPTEEKAIEQWNNRATEAEIRAKAISEFAEKLGRLCENSAMALDRYNGRPLYSKDGKWNDLINDVAEQLKERE